jgi:heat shock protein HslJ
VSLASHEIPPPPRATPSDSPGRDLVPGRRPTIRFTAKPPGAGGRSFCNGYGTPYELRGDSLRLTRIVSSAVGCDGPDSLETRFFRALWGTRRFELDTARLILIAEDGTRLVFVPAAAGPAVP